MSNYLGDTRE